MTIFDILNALLFTKKELDLNVEDEQVFNLFMVNRWTSMHSKELATLINYTTNTGIGSVFNTKQEQFEFLQTLLPKSRFKRIQYLKKKKEKKTEESIDVALLAKNKQISQRELKEYIELANSLSK